MPWVCDACREYSAEPANSPCPKCGVARKFTLLAPPGETPEPVPDAPTTVQHRYGHGAHQTRNFKQPEIHDVAWESFVVPLGVVLGVIFAVAAVVYIATKG